MKKLSEKQNPLPYIIRPLKSRPSNFFINISNFKPFNTNWFRFEFLKTHDKRFINFYLPKSFSRVECDRHLSHYCATKREHLETTLLSHFLIFGAHVLQRKKELANKCRTEDHEIQFKADSISRMTYSWWGAAIMNWVNFAQWLFFFFHPSFSAELDLIEPKCLFMDERREKSWGLISIWPLNK